MASRHIVIRGAREHNLRDVSLDLPRGKLICFTGVSGSGKSSLAFDTIHAEGQRRYVESLSSYARQFLTQLSKPDVNRIDGLGPSISIQQKTGGNNPRSTVGTITEIHDHLRVLFAQRRRRALPELRYSGRRADPRTDRTTNPQPSRKRPDFLARAGCAGRKGNIKTCFRNCPDRATSAREWTAKSWHYRRRSLSTGM